MNDKPLAVLEFTFYSALVLLALTFFIGGAIYVASAPKTEPRTPQAEGLVVSYKMIDGYYMKVISDDKNNNVCYYYNGMMSCVQKDKICSEK